MCQAPRDVSPDDYYLNGGVVSWTCEDLCSARLTLSIIIDGAQLPPLGRDMKLSQLRRPTKSVAPASGSEEAITELIQIDHVVSRRRNILVVDWMLGSPCNYDCHYCPPSLHDGKKRWVASSKILAFSERLADLCNERSLTVFLQFSGGEVTLIPRFVETLKELRGLGCETAILSNGSRSLDWWSEAVRFLNQVVLTFHPESADVNHFSSVASLLSSCTRVHINVAAPPYHFSVAQAAARHFAANCQDVTILLKPMLVGFGDELFPYSAEQLTILRTDRFVAVTSRPVVSARGEMTGTFANGAVRTMQAKQFLTEHLNHWRGWECNIGLESLSIEHSGTIYRGACREGGAIGHIERYLEFDLPSKPIICGKRTCACLLDVMTSRRSRRFVQPPKT
jgi:organic radical activating enzyme